MPGLELSLHHALELGGQARWLRQVLWLTALGGLTVMGPVALIAALWLAWRGRRSDAAWFAATIVVGRLAVEGLKLIVRRPRPPALDRLELVTSWSFPSSHSAGTTMTCVALALLAGGGRGAMAAALAVAATIGWTRVALGVHWPGDVLAGWGCGLLWVAAAWRFRTPPASSPSP